MLALTSASPADLAINYVAGPILGGVLATLLFRATNGNEYGSRGYLEMS